MWCIFLQIITCSNLQLSEEGLGPVKKEELHKNLSKAAFPCTVDLFSVFLKILCMHFVTDNFKTFRDLLFSYITKNICVTLENKVTLMVCLRKESLRPITNFLTKMSILNLVQWSNFHTVQNALAKLLTWHFGRYLSINSHQPVKVQ